MLIRALLVLWLASAASAVASPLPDYPFLFATGTARRDLPPDTVKLDFTIASRNADPAIAAKAVDATFETVLAILTAADVKKADLDASTVNKSARSHWDGTKGQSLPDGYEVTRRIRCTVRDIGNYPQMLKKLLEVADSESFSVRFERSDASKIQVELFTAAAKDARDQADQMASSFDRKIGAVHAISKAPFDRLGHDFGLSNSDRFAEPPAAYASGRHSDMFLVPSSITLSTSVNVVFELK